jgi:putative membrane protein
VDLSSSSSSDRAPKWWRLGRRPDYRFSLANERTFLAWIRTALALIAGAIGIDQFAGHLGTAVVRTGFAVALLAVGGLLAATAHHRWRSVETAMRLDTDLPQTGLMPALAVVATLLAVTLAIVVVAD